MDVLAHTLWANAGARAGNKLAQKKGGKFHVNVGWAAFFGVFPDLFAFTLPFVLVFYKIIFGGQSFSGLRDHHGLAGGFDIASYLYQFSHSLIIWAFIFCVIWFLSKRPRYELLGWALHILIDIPSHAIGFYPTPFLFPISEYRFPYGISWGNTWYMIINYSALAFVWIGIIFKKLETGRNNKKSNGGFVGILVLLIVVSGMIFFMVRTDLFTGQKGGKSMLEQNQDSIDRAGALKVQLEQNSAYPIEE